MSQAQNNPLAKQRSTTESVLVLVGSAALGAAVGAFTVATLQKSGLMAKFESLFDKK